MRHFKEGIHNEKSKISKVYFCNSAFVCTDIVRDSSCLQPRTNCEHDVIVLPILVGEGRGSTCRDNNGSVVQIHTINLRYFFL